MTEKIKEISKALKEPEWLLAWREKRAAEAVVLPTSVKHGIAIAALFPETEPDFAQMPEYKVESTKGIEIYTWKEAMMQEEIEPIVRGLMESIFFPVAKDHYRAVGQALFQSGIVLYVQPNMKDDGTFVTEKITLDTVVPASSSSDVVIVVLKEVAQCEFVSNISGGAVGSVHARTLVVISEQESQIRLTQLDLLSSGAMVMHASRAVVSGHGKVLWRELLMGNALVSSITESVLIGAGATATILQGIIATEYAVFDVDVSSRHLASETSSTIKTAGTGGDSSRTLYRGLVDMHDGVKKVSGSQAAKFLVLSPGAKIDAIPSLDIASSDVTCSHKLSISHVREGDTFYPRLRGLSDTESRALFLEGHFSDVFLGEENADMMHKILLYIEKQNLSHD